MASGVVKFVVGGAFSFGCSAIKYLVSNAPTNQVTDKSASIQPEKKIEHAVKIGFAELGDQVRDLRKAQLILEQKVARQERCNRYLVVAVVAETVLMATGFMAVTGRLRI